MAVNNIFIPLITTTVIQSDKLTSVSYFKKSNLEVWDRESNDTNIDLHLPHKSVSML